MASKKEAERREPKRTVSSLRVVGKPNRSTPVDRSGAKPGRPAPVGAAATVSRRGTVTSESYTIIKAVPKKGTKKVTYESGSPGFAAAKRAYEKKHGQSYAGRVQQTVRRQKKK